MNNLKTMVRDAIKTQQISKVLNAFKSTGKCTFTSKTDRLIDKENYVYFDKLEQLWTVMVNGKRFLLRQGYDDGTVFITQKEPCVTRIKENFLTLLSAANLKQIMSNKQQQLATA